MNLHRLLILSLLSILACAEGPRADENKTFNYYELSFQEPLTINSSEKTIIFSDVGIKAGFCSEVQRFCVVKPVVSASISEIEELKSWADENSWQVNWSLRGGLRATDRLVVTDTTDGISWISIYTDADIPDMIFSATLSDSGYAKPEGPIYLRLPDNN